MKKKILIMPAIVAGLATAAWATTNLTNTATWCTTVAVPDPGERVSAGTGTGGIRTALQCLANRTYGLMTGATTFKQLRIDGVGANSAMSAPGTLYVSGTSTLNDAVTVGADLTTTPGNITAGGNFISTGGSVAAASPTATLAEGTMPIDNIPFARGHINAACNVCDRCVNVDHVSITGGACQIFLRNSPAYYGTSASLPTVLVTPNFNTGNVWATYTEAAAIGADRINVYLQDGSGSKVGTCPFSFVMWP